MFTSLQANADSSTFLEKLQNGFLCFYTVDATCSDVAPLSIIYTLSTAGTTLFSILLIRFAEGAVFTVIIMTFATPLVTLFWTLFSPDPSLHWAPVLDLTAGFLLVGVVIMMPSVGMYAFFRDDVKQGVDDATEQVNQQEVLDAEKRRILQERARTARRHRRRHALTYNGRQNSGRLSQTDFAPRLKSNKGLQRVRSAPVMYGGF